jgi:hypothetical protein
MGIDIYLTWDNMEEMCEDDGYCIRESYHGGPYPSHYLFSESFTKNADDTIEYDSAILMERIIQTIHIAKERFLSVYGDGYGSDIDVFSNDLRKYINMYVNFVIMVKTKEEETSKKCKVYVSY